MDRLGKEVNREQEAERDEGVLDLSDLQLALVGGGGGDVVFH